MNLPVNVLTIKQIGLFLYQRQLRPANAKTVENALYLEILSKGRISPLQWSWGSLDDGGCVLSALQQLSSDNVMACRAYEAPMIHVG
eukprot:525873-Amphidinium_carterae.4